MRKIGITLAFGRLAMIHFIQGKMIGFSTSACFRGLAHYAGKKMPIGKSMRTPAGDLVHYDNNSTCLGYSKYAPLGRMIHYDMSGKEIAYTKTIFWIAAMHYKKWGVQ